MFTTVSDLMTRKPVTLNESDDLGLARALMAHKNCRHLPVIRDQKLVGLITRTHLLVDAAMSNRPVSTTTVSEVMTRSVRTVRAGTPIRRAARTMLDHKIGCLPVLDATNTLVGILTETDLVRFAADVAKELDEVVLGWDQPSRWQSP
jgi:CBS domain-containing protein